MKPLRSVGAYPRTGEPVTFGVPLPSGAVHDDDAWRLTSPSGQSSPAQTRILDRWRDGSGRWMLVDGRVDGASGSDIEYFLEPGEAPPVEAPIKLAQHDRGLTVDTGNTTFRIKPGSSTLFNLPHGPVCAIRVMHPSGHLRDAEVSAAEVEE